MELTKGRATLTGYVWHPLHAPPPGRQDELAFYPDTESLTADLGLLHHAPEYEADGCIYYPGTGTAIPIEIIMLDGRNNPSKREHPYVPAQTRVRMYRDAAIAHLTELDHILEGGRDQLANMTWTNVAEYVARAELLNPTSAVRLAVTPTL